MSSRSRFTTVDVLHSPYMATVILFQYIEGIHAEIQSVAMFRYQDGKQTCSAMGRRLALASHRWNDSSFGANVARIPAGVCLASVASTKTPPAWNTEWKGASAIVECRLSHYKCGWRHKPSTSYIFLVRGTPSAHVQGLEDYPVTCMHLCFQTTFER